MISHDDIRIGTLVKVENQPVEYIRRILPHGFESFELVFPKHLGNIDLRLLADEIRAVLAAEGNTAVVSALAIYGNPLIDAQTASDWSRLVDATAWFGCNLVCGFTGRIPGKPLPDSLPAFKQVFTPLVKQAEERNVRIAFENCDMHGNWETGDWNILDEPVPYDNAPGSEQPLYEHLQLSFRYTLDRLGPHGLPLIGRADWNDCLNLNCFSDTPGQSFQTTTNKDGKVAESVFIAGLFVLAGRELADIARRRGRKDEAERYLAEVAKMEDTVRKHGWDGEWFLRAYDDFGRKVGSKECAEGKIFIETQGFCVLAGIGLDDGMAAKSMESVRKHLATEHGIILQQPAYSKYYLELGEISSYPPGYKENAGIFCHNNPWVMIGNAARKRRSSLRLLFPHQSFGARTHQ